MAKNGQKKWSKEDLAKLEKMCENSRTWDGMARALGRTSKGVKLQAYKMGLKRPIETRRKPQKGQPFNKVEVVSNQRAFDLVPAKLKDTRSWWQKLLGISDQSEDVQSLRIQSKEIRRNLETIHQQLGQLFSELQTIKGEAAEFQYKVTHEQDNMRQQTVAKIARDVANLTLIVSKQENRTRTLEDASMDHSFWVETIRGRLSMHSK